MKDQSQPPAKPIRLGFARRLSPSNAPFFWALTATVVLFAIAERAVWRECGGLGVPLDDTYIHFTYARSIAELTPFVYTPGAQITAGSTSLLWPLLLAVPYALGFKGLSLIWFATAFGFISLAWLARETVLLANGLVDARLAPFAGVMTLAFGANTWFAASGMEVLFFGAVLARSARKAIEWLEDAAVAHPEDAQGKRRLIELCVLAFAAPLARPEGALMSLLIALVLSLRANAGGRVWAPLALIAAVSPNLFWYALTGEATSNTTTAKWLVGNPYYDRARLFQSISNNTQTLFEKLLDGQLWTSMFLPSGVAPLCWCALAALVLVGFRERRFSRVFVLFWLGAGILIPTSYETFLANRLRYIWPFVTPWWVGLTALASCAAQALKPLLGERARFAAFAVATVFVVGLALKLPESIADLAESANAINQQQVWLARWAEKELPPGALIGINDAGALGYLSHKRTFDIVGLTTKGEAQYWVMGSGSRFEHYERLGAAHLPDYFVVYPEWFHNDVLLGSLLAERKVDATILGGRRMAAFKADYGALSSAERPLSRLPPLEIVDRVDVADLESERTHGYQLFVSSPSVDLVFVKDRYADGGRGARTRDRFSLQFSGTCGLLMRLVSKKPIEIVVSIGAERAAAFVTGAESGWEEHQMWLPERFCSGTRTVEVTSPSRAEFAALSYWSLRLAPSASLDRIP